MKWDLNQDYQGTQIRKSGLLRCKSAKCHNDFYAYKTRKYLELQDKLNQSQQRREKVEELKEKNYRDIFKEIEHIFWHKQGENACVDLFKVKNEDTTKPNKICRQNIQYHILLQRGCSHKEKNGRPF